MRKQNFQKNILPFIMATVGEFVALFFWLKFLDQDRWLLANVLLWAGFLIERLSVVLWLRTVYRPAVGVASEQVPVWKAAIGLLLVTLSEIIIWLVWLWVSDNVNFALGAAVLMILMLAEHSVEMSLVKKAKPLAFVTNTRTIFFTVMEVVGGVGWLYFVRHDQALWGALALLIGLGIEHVLQGSQLKPEDSKGTE